MTSTAQINSNRKNAKKSSGPKTPGGKARSRGNAVKHGLTGAGVCLPNEDAALLQHRIEALDDALQPRDEKERILSQRGAVLAIRLDRCVTHETSTLSDRVRNAVSDHDERLMADVFGIVATFHLDPAASVWKLRRTAEGVDYLISRWQGLREALAQFGNLGEVETLVAEQLEGRSPYSVGTSRIKALSHALQGGFHLLGTSAQSWAAVADPETTKAAARVELDERLGVEVERLREHRLTLPHANFAQSRLEAPLRAVVDLSDEGILYRRYETAASRELHKTFAYFDERGPLEEVENVDTSFEESGTSDELGSFRNSAEVEANEVEVGPAPGAETTVEPASGAEEAVEGEVSASLQSSGASLQWVDRTDDSSIPDHEGGR